MNDFKIKVLLVEPEKYPKEIVIDDSLEAMQEVVGGDIEEYMPYDDDVAIICNEEGKVNIQKIVRFNRKEAQDLAAKAKKACLSEAGLIRLLIRGYEPKEKPDDRFYDVMRELSSIGNNINQLAAKANTLGFIDAPMLKNEAAKWNKFQSEIERTYLRPNQSEMKWQ